VVTIRCNNHVIYDFSLDRLSLRDSIQMVRSVRGETVESFHCDTLDLVLRNPADQTVERRGPLDWIDRVHATGQPAKMTLAPYDFELTAEEIDFDSPGGLLRAEGERGVVLQRGNIRAHLARLAYQYNPELPDEIGTLDVLGAGNVTINDPEIMVRQFQWSEGFKLQPTGRATLEDVKQRRTQSKLSLRVDGDIRAQLSNGGTLSAGSIDTLLKPEFIAESTAESTAAVPAAVPASGAFQRPNASVISQPAEPNAQKLTLIPEIFRATGAVSVNTNQVVAEVNELILYFEKAADLGKRPSSTPLGISADASQSDASPRSPGALAGFVNQPTKSDQLRSPVARPRPSLAGDQVVAQLLVTPTGIEAKDVSIKGNVRVKHQVSAGESVMPVELTGDAMRLMRSAVSQASGQDYLQLGSGPESPARIKMGDGYFTGPMIAIWPRDNVVQVNGAGELKVPSQVLNREPSNDSETSGIAISSVRWNSTPYCRWGGSMQFDGRIALLRGGVQIDAEIVSGADPWLTTMNGDEMQIALTQTIDLMNRSSMSMAEIAEVSLVRSPNRPVFVRAEQRDIDQSPLAIHLITADRLDFAPDDGGQLLGTGPGWYRGWMLTDQKNSVLSPRAAESEHLADKVLQGVHLTFRNSMRGDLNRQSLAFDGGVRTGVRKLQSWDESVDVGQMERLKVGEMTMDCQRLQFGITPGMPDDLRKLPGMPTPWEMTAEGGVVVRTHTENRGLIEGTANRASFESTKSWLIVEGAPGRSALIRQTNSDGTPGNELTYPRMAVNLKTYAFEMLMQEAKVNDFPQPGSR
jgi:hypothetical protein